MTTPSDKDTPLEKDLTSPSLIPPTTISTSKAKVENFESFGLDQTFNVPNDNEDKLTELYKELSQLDEKEKKAKDSSITETEFHNIQRLIRKKKREIKAEIQDLSFQRDLKKYKDETKPTSRNAKESKKFEVPTQILQNLTLDEDKKTEYYRTLKLADTYREKIENLYKEITTLMDDMEDKIPEYEKEDKEIELKTKTETLKALLQEYKKRNNEMSLIADVKDIPQHLDNLQTVLDLSNMITSKQEAMEERNKKKLALSKSEQLEGVKLSKFSGVGDQKFLNYYGFYQEFTELVLSKPYSDSTKLRYLKQYLEGDAKDIVKNYHSGEELATAFKALDEVYGRADMVIRECIKSIQKLEPLRSEHNIKANKNFLYKITTNVSTLRCYNFDIDNNETENSTLMISIEEKLPHETFMKWEDKKAEMRNDRQKITIDAFLTFFTERVRREENASFVRNSSKQDGENKGTPGKFKAKMFQMNIKDKSQKGTGYNNFKRPQNKGEFKPGANNPSTFQPKLYCIFCEQYGNHSSSWCKIRKYTSKFKESQAIKNKACLSCLRTTDHKSDNCPRRRLCRICNKYHHFNLHSRDEISNYFAKMRQGNHNQK